MDDYPLLTAAAAAPAPTDRKLYAKRLETQRALDEIKRLRLRVRLHETHLAHVKACAACQERGRELLVLGQLEDGA